MLHNQLYLYFTDNQIVQIYEILYAAFTYSSVLLYRFT